MSKHTTYDSQSFWMSGKRGLTVEINNQDIMTCLSRFQASFFPITWVKPRLWNTVNEWDHMLHMTSWLFVAQNHDIMIVCCTEYLCTSLCLAPGERGQAYSTPGIWPNVFSFGWRIERDLTKLKISRVGIFDKVAKEPESYNQQLPPPPRPWPNVEQTALILMAWSGSVPSVL